MHYIALGFLMILLVYMDWKCPRTQDEEKQFLASIKPKPPFHGSRW